MTRDIENEPLKDLVARAPMSAGCYLWKDNSDTVLYVGKAIKLRSRLRNYMKPEDTKTRFLMSKATRLEWILVDSESEALILEDNLIKKYKPRYNVRLKDDKRYPFICVSTSEMYPRVYVTRVVRDDGNRYFGPYTDVRAARSVMEFIHKVFPIRKVRQTLPLKKPRRPCMNFHIRRCLAPCTGTVAVEEYDRIVQEIILFLEGRREVLEEMVQRRMERYSQSLEFEKAAIYRDLLLHIKRTTEQQSVMSPGGGDEDIIAVARDGENAQVALMEVRGGRLLDRKSFPLQGVEESEEAEIIESFLREYYLEAVFVPPRINVTVPVKDGGTMERHLSSKTGRKVRIGSPRGTESASMMGLARKNAELLLKERLLATKIRDEKTALKELQDMLSLSRLPSVIECYDISHLGGTNTVASGVRFVDGRPQPSGYRKYKIKSVEGIDDPASMREVIARRIQKLQNDNLPLPDLFVIDGGITQLNAACEAASALGAADATIISLAKQREELYFPGDPYPHRFDENSPGMRLLRQARDEAHRFGVTFQRKLRGKSTIKSILDQVPDIGPARRKAILKMFGAEKLIDLTEDELSTVPGIGEGLARKIALSLTNIKRKKSTI